MGRPSWAEKLLNKTTDAGSMNKRSFDLKSFSSCSWLDDSDEELFRRTGNYLTKSTVLRSGTIDCLRCADFKHDVAHSVCSDYFHRCNLSFSSPRNFYDLWNFILLLAYFSHRVVVNI